MEQPEAVPPAPLRDRGVDIYAVAVDSLSMISEIMKRPGPVRLVAIDGPGGSGKTTLAAELAAAAGHVPVIHTDDFASADNPINWWPRLLEQVILPLSQGATARYQRYDWPSESLAEWHEVDPAPIILIEGVSAGRREWAEHLSYLIWIDTPPDQRLERGVERDGAESVGQWRSWMAEEDAHYERDPTKRRADVVVSGSST